MNNRPPSKPMLRKRPAVCTRRLDDKPEPRGEQIDALYASHLDLIEQAKQLEERAKAHRQTLTKTIDVRYSRAGRDLEGCLTNMIVSATKFAQSDDIMRRTLHLPPKMTRAQLGRLLVSQDSASQPIMLVAQPLGKSHVIVGKEIVGVIDAQDHLCFTSVDTFCNPRMRQLAEKNESPGQVFSLTWDESYFFDADALKALRDNGRDLPLIRFQVEADTTKAKPRRPARLIAYPGAEAFGTDIPDINSGIPIGSVSFAALNELVLQKALYDIYYSEEDESGRDDERVYAFTKPGRL